MVDSHKKCSKCGGTGSIRTGGCSLEHGISTSCDEYGCLPIRYERCPVCQGKQLHISFPSRKVEGTLLATSPHQICSYTDCSQPIEDSSAKQLPFNEEEQRNYYDYFTFCKKCWYCESRLTQEKLSDVDLRTVSRTEFERAQNDAEFGISLTVKRCVNCGWWDLEYSRSGWRHTPTAGIPFSTKVHIVGEAKHYDVSQMAVPITLLRRHLADNPKALAHVNPKKFELLMKDCLAEHFGAVEVIHTGGTGDGGIDLKMILTDDETYLVQIKRRSDLSKREGVQVVRELNGVLFREGEAKGMVVSTAPEFTQAAQKEARIATKTVQRYQMKLVAFDDIVTMLRLHSPEHYEPWRDHLAKLRM